MPGQSVFGDEWRECLRTHFMYVVRNNDTITERTLKGVLYEVGFTEAELNELRVLATAHVDDVGADFVPDLQTLEKTAFVSLPLTEAVVQTEAIPAQTIEGEAVPSGPENPAVAAIAAPPTVEPAPIIDEQASKDAVSDAIMRGEEASEADDDPGAVQLSMF